ncbi:MAG: prepilin peptidase [Patescibacteria group bacterium]
MNLAIFFIFGLFLGSFLNNVALRLENDESFIFSRSKCPKCKKKLKWYNLIPLLSYIIQLGKCSSCREKISIRYPLTEIFAGIFTFGLAKVIFTIYNFHLLSSFIIFLYYLSFISAFFVLALIDFKTKYISEKLIYFMVAVWLIFQAIFYFVPVLKIAFIGAWSEFFEQFLKFPNSEFIGQIFTAFIAALPFLFLFAITLGWGVGLGDSKVAFVMGLFFKPGDFFLSLVMAIFLGGIVGVIILLKTQKFKQEIPYVPFLFAGTLVAMFWGEMLITNYFKIFR